MQWLLLLELLLLLLLLLLTNHFKRIIQFRLKPVMPITRLLAGFFVSVFVGFFMYAIDVVWLFW